MAGASAHAARNSDERLVGLYLDMLAAERGAGANTLSAYRRDLEDLSSYLRGLRRAIASARTADLRSYLEELSRRGLKATTAARRLSAIRQLYRFLYTEAHRRDDPAAVLEGPKRQRASRLACLLEILYATGLRVSELVALPIAAARRDARVIVVRGKGNKERLVPLND